MLRFASWWLTIGQYYILLLGRCRLYNKYMLVSYNIWIDSDQNYYEFFLGHQLRFHSTGKTRKISQSTDRSSYLVFYVINGLYAGDLTLCWFDNTKQKTPTTTTYKLCYYLTVFWGANIFQLNICWRCLKMQLKSPPSFSFLARNVQLGGPSPIGFYDRIVSCTSSLCGLAALTN